MGVTAGEVLGVRAPGSGETVRLPVMMIDSTGAVLTGQAWDADGMAVYVAKEGASSFTAFPTFGTDNWDEIGYGNYDLILRQSDADELALLDTPGHLRVYVKNTASRGDSFLFKVNPADAARDDQWTDARALKIDDISTAATVADAVWDEATSGHTTAGTFGAWATGLVAAVWAYATRTITSWSNLVASLTTSQLSGAINAARNITRYYGDSAPLYFTLTDCPGTVTYMTLAIGRREGVAWDEALVRCDSDAIGGITITDGAAGSATIDLTDEQLALLTQGTYSYSIKVTIGGDRYTACTGKWEVKAAQDATLDPEAS